MSANQEGNANTPQHAFRRGPEVESNATDHDAASLHTAQQADLESNENSYSTYGYKSSAASHDDRDRTSFDRVLSHPSRGSYISRANTARSTRSQVLSRRTSRLSRQSQIGRRAGVMGLSGIREDPEEAEEAAKHDEVLDLTQAAEDFVNLEPGTPQRKKTYLKVKDVKAVRKARDVLQYFLNLSVWTRCFIYWFPGACVLFLPLAMGVWVNHNASLGHVRIFWIFLWLLVAWSTIFLVYATIHLVPPIVSIVVGICYPKALSYVSIVEAMQFPIALVLIFLIMMITFARIITVEQNWAQIINNIIVSFLIASVVYCAERLVIHLTSRSFHRTQFSSRIRRSKQIVALLGDMLMYARKIYPPFSKQFEWEDSQLESANIFNKGMGKMNFVGKKNVQKALGRVNRGIYSAANVFKTTEGATQTERQESAKIVSEAIQDDVLCQVLAHRIWKSFVPPDEDFLTEDVLLDAMGEDKEATVVQLFDLLDEDGDRHLSLNETVKTLQDVLVERAAIYQSLRDMDTVIGKLHKALMFVVLLVSIIIIVGMLAPNVSTVLATFGSTMLALSFAFSATAQEFLNAIVFLFVKHPFDVGDLVNFNGDSNQFIVQEINLMYSTFAHIVSACVYQVPNSVLNTYGIYNMTRSGPQNDPVVLNVGMPDTSIEKINLFKEQLYQWLEENREDYFPNPYVECVSMPDLDKIQIFINVTYKDNFSDVLLFGRRRTKLLKYIGYLIGTIPLHITRREESYNHPSVPLMMHQPNYGSLNDEKKEKPEKKEVGKEDLSAGIPMDRYRMGFAVAEANSDPAQPILRPSADSQFEQHSYTASIRSRN